MSPRPNELSGEAEPNVLSVGIGRAASKRTPAIGAATPTRAPAATRSPSAPIARPRRRPFGLWTLIVFAIVAFNLFRAFGNQGASSPEPTTAPRPTAQVVTPPPDTTAGDALRTIDPNVTPGVVDFGTGAEPSCDVTGKATTFNAGTPVWWYAHFETYLPGRANVVFTLTQGGTELDRETGPGDASDDDWNGLCAGEPLLYDGLGTYDFVVFDSSAAVVLSKGTYDLIAAAP